MSVYPFLSLLENPCPLRPPYPPGRFVLDQHLSRLASYLRALGLDAVCRDPFPDEELARVASKEKRILLTRDKGLLMRREVIHGHFVRATDPQKQVPEVLHHYGAWATIAPFSRCLCCNTLLSPTAKEAVADRLLPETRAHYEAFWTCPTCERVYWDGPHVRRMRTWMERWLREAANPDGV